MKIAIKKRLVFYWFLFTEWIKKIIQLNQLGPNEDSVQYYQNYETNMAAKKSQFTKKVSDVKMDEHSVEQTSTEQVNADKNSTEKYVAETIPVSASINAPIKIAEPPPLPVAAINETTEQTDSSLNLLTTLRHTPNQYNNNNVFSAPFLTHNLEKVHSFVDSKLAFLSSVISFNTKHVQKLHLKASTILHNGELDANDCDELINSVLTSLYEELCIQAEQTNIISKESLKNTVLMFKPYSKVSESIILNKITEVWYYYIEDGAVVLVHKVSSIITIYCADVVQVLYSGILINFLQEIYNPMTPKIVYGSHFEVVCNQAWKIYNESN